MNIGWFFLGASVVTYGSWGFFAKVAENRGASSFLLTFLTAMGALLVALIVCAPRMEWTKSALPMNVLLPGVLAGIAVGVANVFLYRALSTIPASVAFPVSSLYIVVTALLVAIFLKEHISISHAAGIACALLAVFLLSR